MMSISKNFIDEQLQEIALELKETQIEIQRQSDLKDYLQIVYYTQLIQFEFWISIAYNYSISNNFILYYIAWQQAMYNYEQCDCLDLYIQDISYKLDYLKVSEKLIKQDYSEIMMAKLDNYNASEYATFMYRSEKRIYSLSEDDEP